MNNQTTNPESSDLTPKKHFTDLDKIQLWIVLVAICSIVLVFSFYFYQFRGELSSDHSIWGQFGDYVAGLLGPFLSFIVIIILVYTLRATNETLSISREQLNHSEQMLKTMKDELTITKEELKKSREISEQHVKHLNDEALKNELHVAMKEYDSELQKLFQQKANFPRMQGSYEYFFSTIDDDESSRLIPENSKDVTELDKKILKDLCIVLFKLHHFMKHYDEISQNSAINKLYLLKYRNLYQRLVAKKYMEPGKLDLFEIDKND